MGGSSADARGRACGDGAVGLCAVLAAKTLGAEQVIAFSRHEDRAARRSSMAR